MALIRPLTWEPPYVKGAALEKVKDQKKKKEEEEDEEEEFVTLSRNLGLTQERKDRAPSYRRVKYECLRNRLDLEKLVKICNEGHLNKSFSG